jgi:glycosyltransferase involved in cell wall biosynthesis
MLDLGPTPRVIVGLPVRNGDAHLQEAIDSVLAQEFGDFRLIVADNGSTDATPSIVMRAAARDPRVVYRRFDEVVDVATSFNRLLEWSTATYFIWMAHDDIWESTLLQRLVDLLDLRPKAALAYAGLDSIDSEGRTVREYAAIGELAFGDPRWRRLAKVIAAREDSGKANLVLGLLRGEVVRQSGGFRVYTPHAWGLDYHLLFKFAVAGTFEHHNELLFHKRVSTSGAFPPLRERVAYALAYARISRESQLPLRERAAVLVAIGINLFKVLRDRSGLYFSVPDAFRSLKRRLLPSGPR